MLYLLKKCSMVITDSGGLQKESYFAQKKCLVVREQSEWEELINDFTNKLCSPKNILSTFNKHNNVSGNFNQNYFGKGNCSQIIIDSIKNFFS